MRPWLALLAITMGGGAMVVSCSNSSSGQTPPPDGSSTDPPGDSDGGDPPEAGARVDGGSFDAGPCPGMTSCGSACVQTRTDLNNCGACGVVCSATAPSTVACVIGKCIVTLATSSTGAVADLAVQGTDVFFSTTAGTIERVSMAGGTPVTLVTGQNNPHSVAVDATSVYWIVDGVSAIRKVPIGGGGVSAVTQFAPGAIVDLAIDSTNAYYTTGTSYVMSVPLAGAVSAKQVAKGGLYPAQRLALDAARVYFTQTDSTVYVGPIDGGTATVFASSPGIPQSGLAVTANDVFWGTSSITVRAPSTGGFAYEHVHMPLSGVAYDTADLFAFTPSGTIVRISPNGGLPNTLTFRNAASAGELRDIAVDGTSVYWTENSGGAGRVMKLSPK